MASRHALEPDAVGAALRRARAQRSLTQTDLAHAARLAQRQISDLERGVVDARLSTVQNIARHLDLELMLVPRVLVATVEGLVRGVSPLEPRGPGVRGEPEGDAPLYALDERFAAPVRPERP